MENPELGGQSAWLSPPAQIRLEPGELQVWRALEPAESDRLDTFVATLSPDEHERACSFRFETDRRRFVFCRGVLRELLGRYLAQAPGSIAFAYDPRGKPMLAGAIPLQFNLSHTKGMSLFAFSRSDPVGVDVERVRPSRDMEAIAERFFHSSECAAIAEWPPADRQRAFYANWVCKEAWLKIEGIGIAGGLDAIQVGLPLSLVGDVNVKIEPVERACEGAWVRLLDAGPGWSSAVASRGRPNRLHTWQYHYQA